MRGGFSVDRENEEGRGGAKEIGFLCFDFTKDGFHIERTAEI